ncbi:PAQR family membrane homeostasis protein TrhA [Thalassotalea sp. PS06]|uniref:PAQR family membrane homeostasis protein TrhA n=1 Tax=Thalassotalea sp. PS06 TaxID=2594005 RepID=UPI00116549E0|nr:hemolysin III family protein [Thalassotalea sp. PS06]QDP00492.1 hemolysin III family protein [Thalassotalea sp. PS06]
MSTQSIQKNLQQNLRQGYSLVEELVNSITHGVGALLSVAALTLMIIVATNAAQLTSAIIYGTSMILLFLASTLYHSITHTSVKSVLKLVDHCAIYLLIAGTYTPFMLISLEGAWGYAILSIVWTLAIAGIFFKLIFKQRFPKVSLATYLAMGWLVVIAMPEMIANVATGGLILLASGGAAYTLGAVFYAIKKIPFNHAIWHVFVLAGSVCHFLAVYIYLMG